MRPTPRPSPETSLGNHETRIRTLERQQQQPSRMPWILMQGDLNGFTAVDAADSYPQLNGLQVSPNGAGGNIDPAVFGAIDPGGGHIPVETGFSSNEPFKAINILQPGLYLFEVGAGWYLNWGAVRVNYSITSTDGIPNSIVNFRNFINGTENSYFGGAADATAPQMEIHARTILAIDERATDVQVRGFIHNHSGVNRVYGTNPATNQGGFGIYIVQLSPSGHSNP